jgi:hypothetical protein
MILSYTKTNAGIILNKIYNKKKKLREMQKKKENQIKKKKNNNIILKKIKFKPIKLNYNE